MTNDIFTIPTPRFANALCAEIGDPDLWFPESREERKDWTAPAKKVCFNCVERLDCLNFALEFDIREGIWGGEDERSRARFQPRSASGKVNSSKGARAYRLARSGLSHEQIANHLALNHSSVSKMISRYKRKIGEIK